MTGLGQAPGEGLSAIGGRSGLAEAVVDATERTIELVADLSDEQLVGPLLGEVNPLIWEIGHLAWFEEKFVLRQANGESPLLSYGDALYDSGAVPHDTRWRLALPSRSDTVTYMREVTNRVVERVVDPGATDVVRHFALYAAFHYDWHTEAITYTRQTLGYPAPRLTRQTLGYRAPRLTGVDRTWSATPGDPVGGDVMMPGGRVVIGATRATPFAYDNEKWAHPVDIRPFRMARAPVTESEFLSFVDDGGYQRRSIWSSEAWAWREKVDASHPIYWRRDGRHGWQRRLFDRWIPLDAHRPVVHVSWYEADTFARWAGRRLPTESEWEAAATAEPEGGRRRALPWGDHGVTAEHANVDWLGMDVVDVAAHPAGDSPAGCRQLIGNVWEWTATTFAAYPNFERDAYSENSEQFFGTRKVLRGGSWATRSRLVRNTLRNYFTPDRRDAFTGFRTCAVQQ